MISTIMESLKKEYSGKKVLIVGLGLQGGGVGLAKFFSELGAKVTITDKKNEEQLKPSIEQLRHLPITFRLGEHKSEDFLNSDVIFKGPSVPWDLPQIQEAKRKGVPIEMDLAFFAFHFPGKIIGITGTRGKSTTTHLIFQLLKHFNYPAHLAGSLPDISTVSLLKDITPDSWVVMELSSWGLSGFHQKKISPYMAAFTNLYPDHLNYYKTMGDYLYDKKAIFLYQKPGDYLVANKSLGKYITSAKSKTILITAKDFPGKLHYLQGQHNLENAAAAYAVAKILNLNLHEAEKVISGFKGLPGRQEIVGEKAGVTFINDTTSTTPIATIKAMETFSGKPIILLLGGNAKGLPYDQLIDRLDKVEKIFLLKGTFTDELLSSLKNRYPKKITPIYDNFKKAIYDAYSFAKNLKKEVYILFSPAATSFAMFANEFQRGSEFNRIVKLILSGS